MFETLAIWLKAHCERAAAADERSEHELAALADELGIEIDVLADVAEHARDLRHLTTMLRVLEIDETVLRQVEPTLLNDLRSMWGLGGAELSVLPSSIVAPEAAEPAGGYAHASLPIGLPEVGVDLAALWAFRASKTLH